MEWKRPCYVEYPKIWSSFESEKTKQRFVVKDLTPEYYDITLGYMTNMFLNESAICKPLKILEDSVARMEMQRKWLSILKGNVAIICVTEGEVPRVAGVHMTMVRQRYGNGVEKNATPPTGQYGKFARVVEQLTNEGNLFDKFGADYYLGSLGLFVLPEFRGLGIATQILKARIVMCRCLSLPGTATVFSTPGGQAAARKAGYERLASKTPEECKEFKLDHTLIVMGISVPLKESVHRPASDASHLTY